MVSWGRLLSGLSNEFAYEGWGVSIKSPAGSWLRQYGDCIALAAEIARLAGLTVPDGGGMMDTRTGQIYEAEAPAKKLGVGDLPFGVDRPACLTEPFCACGRVVSRCDRSRSGCTKRLKAGVTT